MTTVSVDYDTTYDSWNVMLRGKCIFYGTASQVDNWLAENRAKYKEEI